jgi:hypothetical protein
VKGVLQYVGDFVVCCYIGTMVLWKIMFYSSKKAQ